MPLYPHVIFTPEQVHEVHSPDAYRALVASTMRKGRQTRPSLIWPEPFVASTHPTVLINDGKWQLRCDCGNYASVHPDWRLACCLNCAAIYDDLDIPVDRVAIEAALLQRPVRATRNWVGESVEALVAEQAAQGELA